MAYYPTPMPQQMYQNPYASIYNPAAQYGMQKSEIIKVNGRHGAEAYQLAPNSSALLLDESGSVPLVWYKSTDGAGYPTLTPYQMVLYSPQEQQQPAFASAEDFEALRLTVNELSEYIEKLKGGNGND